MAYDEKNIRLGMTGFGQLLLLNVLFFVLVHLSQWEDADGRMHSLREWLGLIPDRAFTQPWRWFTYMFVHADFGHFIFNMWGMMIFGPILERAVGRSRVLSAYLICGLLGAAIWYVFNMKSYANLMGASAAVVGYLVAAAVLFPDERMRLLFPPIDVSLKTLAIVFVGIDVLMLFNTGGRVAHLAHLGGAVGGLLMFRSVLLQRASQASRRRKFAPKSLHVCATCGVTDAKNPQLDFRVCSSCAGSEEYCEAHLRSHEHTLEKTDG